MAKVSYFFPLFHTSDLDFTLISVVSQVVDGPDDTGEQFERPAKLSDKLPMPYMNEAVSRCV